MCVYSDLYALLDDAIRAVSDCLVFNWTVSLGFVIRTGL